MSAFKKLLRLDSMTLRGVGSYFNGAELKIRPLTILCGTNGSGKSTWFNVLGLLQRSLAKDKLPFSLDADDDWNDMQLTNARLHLGSEDLREDAEQDRRFGPYGTIGLAGEAIEDGNLFDQPEEPPLTCTPKHVAAKLLWEGKFTEGATFRLRVAHSSRNLDQYHQEFVELCFNGEHFIRMSQPKSSSKSSGNGYERAYELVCSKSFLDLVDPHKAAAYNREVHVVDFQHQRAKFDLSALEINNDPHARDFAKACVRLILAVYKHLLSGFLRITAVRESQEITSLAKFTLRPEIEDLIAELRKEPADRKTDQYFNQLLLLDELIQQLRMGINSLTLEERVESRYVGPHGENALGLWRKFAMNAMRDRAVPDGYTLSIYLSYWLHRLMEIEIDHPATNGWKSGPTLLCGFLKDTIPRPVTEAEFPHGSEFTWDSLTFFHHPCFNTSGTQGPSRLPAGFHQLFPILTQTALMQRHEIMAVENPEVHLHPSLQLAVAEFLMHQALGGKTIIVETHSDLIIRRLMRAMLEEDIKQEALSIQFASLKKPYYPEASSVLEPLRINDHGQIENWPAGFLDDDIKESRRLFEIMYGTMPEIDDAESA